MKIEEEVLAEAEEARSSLADALLVTRQGINPLDVPKKEETVADPETEGSICHKKKKMVRAPLHTKLSLQDLQMQNKVSSS